MNRREASRAHAGGRRFWDQGFILLEILVASFSGLVVIATIAATFAMHRKIARAEEMALDLEEALRRSLATIAREVRQAGFDPSSGGSFDGLSEGILEARRDRLGLRADINGAPDGVIDSTTAEETTIYRTRSSGSLLLRTGARPDPLSRPGQLASGDLSFRYFDGCGAEIRKPSWLG